MPRVIVTCPNRRGIYNGVWAIGKHFPDGDTTLDLTDEELEQLEGEIARKESILTVKRAAAEAASSPEAAAAAKVEGVPAPVAPSPQQVPRPAPILQPQQKPFKR
jgi:hypothetical protein